MALGLEIMEDIVIDVVGEGLKDNGEERLLPLDESRSEQDRNTEALSPSSEGKDRDTCSPAPACSTPGKSKGPASHFRFDPLKEQHLEPSGLHGFPHSAYGIGTAALQLPSLEIYPYIHHHAHSPCAPATIPPVSSILPALSSFFSRSALTAKAFLQSQPGMEAFSPAQCTAYSSPLTSSAAYASHALFHPAASPHFLSLHQEYQKLQTQRGAIDLAKHINIANND
ncbi:forkhead box D7 [Scomber scombrus]|uniref:Forkhead box D7 n=1 Tax=Scomber scombrus TaxID=13677 RepID=A0AAV1NLK4_SCOSC